MEWHGKWREGVGIERIILDPGKYLKNYNHFITFFLLAGSYTSLLRKLITNNQVIIVALGRVRDSMALPLHKDICKTR